MKNKRILYSKWNKWEEKEVAYEKQEHSMNSS